MKIDNMRDDHYGLGLRECCSIIKNKLGSNLVFVEIGAYQGEGTMIFSQEFPNSIIHSVDIWEKYVEDCSVYDMDYQQKVLEQAEINFDLRLPSMPNVIKHKMPSIEFAKLIDDKSVNFVYIDGNHSCSYVKQDITTWLPKIKDGGILAGHDYCWDSIKQALSELNIIVDYSFQDASWIKLL